MNRPSRKTLQKYFPSGPCLICCNPTYRQGHRLIDALRDRYHGGDSVRAIARDCEGRPPVNVIRYVVTAPIRDLNFLRRNFTKGAAEELRKAINAMGDS